MSTNGAVRVMVVDDTDHVRNMLVDMLELDGFEVCGQAASGEDAVNLADEAAPDVIVMDYKMPGMDGLTAARTIRQTRTTQPIILYTAYLDPTIEAQAKEAGIALCIGKVEGLNQLERHITELCRDLRP
ncbi:MAG: two-component system, response regulator PdtaR [Actinomycetota bacterium]|nr:two-component system, response regulator PdtaR [Actinomycetota bacterium]